jgi:hypothetical protein
VGAWGDCRGRGDRDKIGDRRWYRAGEGKTGYSNVWNRVKGRVSNELILFHSFRSSLYNEVRFKVTPPASTVL